MSTDKTPLDVANRMHDIVTLLQRARLPLAEEKITQASIADVLSAKAITFEREFRLSDEDIPDFLLTDGICVEVKLRGQRRSIYRQLERYAAHDKVKGIILATSICMRLPENIHGKLALTTSLSRGWL